MRLVLWYFRGRIAESSVKTRPMPTRRENGPTASPDSRLSGGKASGKRMRGAGRIRTDDGGFAIRCLSHLATAPEKRHSKTSARLRQDVRFPIPFFDAVASTYRCRIARRSATAGGNRVAGARFRQCLASWASRVCRLRENGPRGASACLRCTAIHFSDGPPLLTCIGCQYYHAKLWRDRWEAHIAVGLVIRSHDAPAVAGSTAAVPRRG